MEPHEIKLHEEHKALRENKIRVFVTPKVGGNFGFEIYTATGDAGKPWERNSYFTEGYDSYELALKAGIQEGFEILNNKEK